MSILNKPFRFFSTQWGADIVLYIGEYQKFQEYLKKRFHFDGSGLINHINPNVYALSFRLLAKTDQHTIAYVMWLPEFDFKTGEYVALAHETIHIVCHILDDRQVDYSDDAKESLTYTFDDIYGRFLKELHKQYQPKLTKTNSKGKSNDSGKRK